MEKILFASSEVYPLIKTGGLADVSASLPIALQQLGHDIRIVMPAYRACLAALVDIRVVSQVKIEGYLYLVEILEAKLPGYEVPIWLIHSPVHFDREGGPYSDIMGEDWEDNAARFALFSRAIAMIGINRAGLNWQADIVHCNDWQTGLTPALLSDYSNRPATLFTIHNLAYQGLFSRQEFEAIDLPPYLWGPDGVEFYSQLSFMKAALNFADKVTTVSPSYAEEICTEQYGYGLEGLLDQIDKQGRLVGILNGIDTLHWDPTKDDALATNYSYENLHLKADNKRAIQHYFDLPRQKDVFLLGFISRLVHQKGIDLIIATMHELMAEKLDVQLVCLGSGDSDYERELQVLSERFPDKIGVRIGYDEKLAHQIEAGIDAFLMPSRFEPCGLNQLYSLRYGSLPIVRSTGGLADSVVDADGQGAGTGFKFVEENPDQLVDTVRRAYELFRNSSAWHQMQKNAMQVDVSWQRRAKDYIKLYEDLMSH